MDSSIVVTSWSLSRKLLFVVNEHNGEDFGQDMSFARFSADLVHLVDMVEPAAVQEPEELIDERVSDIASENLWVVKGIQGFDQEGQPLLIESPTWSLSGDLWWL
jgi:hypothetical protein